MPPLRCPVCKAENGQGPLCRRCKADLSLLFAVEDQRRDALEAARAAAAAGRWEEFRAAAAKADWLRSDDESRQLLAVGCLLLRDFEAALGAAGARA